MIRSILFFSLSLLTLKGYSQPIKFQRTYGTQFSEYGEAKPTLDGGYIIVGHTDSFPSTPPFINSECILIKTDSTGNMQWSKKFTKPNYASDGARIIQTLEGGYLFRIQFYKNGNMDHCCLVKTDSNGDTLWTKCGLCGNVLLQNNDSTYVLAGGGRITKTDKQGNILWVMDYPGAYGGTSHCSITSDGGYILFGTTTTYASGGPTDSDLYLVKTDSAGTMQWNKIYGLTNGMEGVGYGFGRCVQQTADKGYILTGSTDGWGAGNRDILVLKTDSVGNLQWVKTYGSSYQDRGTSIREVGGAVGYILTAVSYGVETPQNSLRTMMIRLDGAGNIMWCKMYGSVSSNPWNASDEGYYVDVVPGTNGGFVFSGHTNSMGLGNADIWLVKTDANGVSGCNEIAQTLLQSTPPLTIFSAGNDTSMAFSQPEDSIVYMTSMVYQDSVLCPTPINPVVEEEELQYLISIYPNPASGAVTIAAELLQITSVEVVNVLGQKVHEQATETASSNSPDGLSLITVNLRSQPDGIYFVRVQTEKGAIGSKKMVLIK